MADDQHSRRDRDREIDRLALDGTKTEWQEASAPAASDPVSDDERRGLNVLGQSDPRGDGAIGGVSDPNEGDVHASEPIIARAGEQRVSPPLVDDAGTGDGDISVSGGAAGGA
ncbi:hypothetical protein tb265_05880 [Gemmatimonadetes bacterium T265]|nr:hypothetical protein tb265_05880 [Gemmatimonadetes bacterium T265]